MGNEKFSYGTQMTQICRISKFLFHIPYDDLRVSAEICIPIRHRAFSSALEERRDE
jgi:hypothetical protein